MFLILKHWQSKLKLESITFMDINGSQVRLIVR